MNPNSFPDPKDRFKLGDILEYGAYGKIYAALDQKTNKNVAVKVQLMNKENESYLSAEYKILKDLSDHANIVDFYGAFFSKSGLMFVIELCGGGSVKNLVTNLRAQSRTLMEEHIAHILKETVKGLMYLHQMNIVHRNVNADNIFLTKEGEIKIGGFSICKVLSSAHDKTGTFIGSPCWIAPEVVLAKNEDENLYDNRCDVWSLGITAIELADGQAPYQNMYPTRILFQIVRNPPPTLYRPFNWSLNYSDFIDECLVKNPDYRPYMEEVILHPFLADVPENNYYLSMEIKSLVNSFSSSDNCNQLDYHVKNNSIYDHKNKASEVMFFEDIAAMDNITEKNVLLNFKRRFQRHLYQVYAGDVLVTVNNNKQEKFSDKTHQKFICKSQSENEPHIFAIADSAYQNALHHSITQKIILLGESGSGKTKNYLHCIDHLLYIGKNDSINVDRFKKAIFLIQAFTNASTPLNQNSTRCILNTDVSYGGTGKTTALTFKMNLLEKNRISTSDKSQANFHILYYFYDGLVHTSQHKNYFLNSEREYKFLRIADIEKENSPRSNIKTNIEMYNYLKEIMTELNFTEEKLQSIFKCLAAVILLGELRFYEDEKDDACLSNPEIAKNVAKLLEIDENKFVWVLTNYCLLRDGLVLRKKASCDESLEARDILANNIYNRITDYLIGYINHEISAGKNIFGERYLIQILDYPGFESFKTNNLWQLYINSFNEELRYYYSQKNFNWEMLDLDLAEVQYKPISYYDNQKVLDELLGKNGGLLSIINQAARMEYNGKYISDCIYAQDSDYITSSKPLEFSVAHYAGKVYYDSTKMAEINKDFMSPEIFQTLRSSKNPIIKSIFTEKLNKTGNLMLNFKEQKSSEKKSRYMSAFHKMSNIPRFSQTKRMRNLNTLFKAVSTEILTDLSRTGGVQFVICIRGNLESKPETFCAELIRQQTKAMLVVQTAKMRKEGYSCRISFAEFLKRYKFLAFGGDEEVEINAENCRLLLIRLKLEGWVIGKRTVFLKYYNEEYLARAYENQVKKIIKMQSMVRKFLTKCRLKGNKRSSKMVTTGTLRKEDSKDVHLTEEEAAEVIQKAYRSHMKKEKSSDNELMDEASINFIKPWALKWKRQSLFGILLQYKSMRIRDFFNFSQQVHFYNEKVFHNLQQLPAIDLNKINREITAPPWVRKPRPIKLKMNFLVYNLPYYDNSKMLEEEYCRPNEEIDYNWHKPLKWKEESYQSNRFKHPNQSYQEETMDLVDVPFDRNPNKKWEEPAIDDNTEEETEKSIKQNKNKTTAIKANKFERNVSPKLNPKPTYQRKSPTFDSTQPANKDFDYIKSPVLRPVNKPDHINELKSIARRDNNDEEDNPPFNFRGMLRKTNFQRESLKSNSTDENRVPINLKKSNSSIVCNGSVEPKREFVSIRLTPEIVLEGDVFNL